MVFKGWVEQPLEKLVSFKTGKLNSNAATKNGQYPFFTCSQETFRTDTFSFDTECVLLGGNNANGVYPLKFFSGKFDAYQRTYIIRALDHNILFNKFLYYALNFKLEQLRKVSTGATTKFLTLTILNDFKIIFPNKIETQRKIAGILSAYDDLIENNNKRIKILEEIAHKLYKHWFVDFKFPGHETTRFVESELGLIPEGWEVKVVSQVIQINPPTKATPSIMAPFIPMQSLSESSMVIFPIESRIPSGGAKFRNADTLFARITPCLENGKTGFVQFMNADNIVATGSTEFIVLRETEYVNRYFIYCLARSEYFRENSINSMGGADGRQRVNTKLYDKLNLFVPDKSMMSLFAASVAPIFECIQTMTNMNQILKAARNLLLPRLISGELSVEELEVKI